MEGDKHMGRLLRINMNQLQVKEEPVPSEYECWGGRGLTSIIIHKEVPPLCHPLSSKNKLVIAPGCLGGTTAPCAGRLSVGAKSPLTGGIKESNTGGQAAHALSRLGITSLIIEGKPQENTNKIYKLYLSSSEAQLLPAPELKGLGNYDTAAMLKEQYGDKVALITIGQAGEMTLSAASIAVTDIEFRPTRHAGRGGMGAVMGSKGLKAIIIDSKKAKQPRSLKDPDTFRNASRKFAQILKEHPITGEGLPTYGTNVLANIINEAGGYPSYLFTAGQFAGTDKISGETQHDIILQRGGKIKHACHTGCTIGCSRIWVDKEGNYVTKGPEYETIWSHGANCGIDNLDAIAQMDRLEDDIGLDTIEIGVTIGIAMAAGLKKFGDAAGAIELVKEIGQGTPLGRILGNGAAVTAQVFGIDRVPATKRQALPAYDPRTIKGIGVTYATSPMGGDHTAGYSIATNILGIGGSVDPLRREGQVDLSRNLQIATAAIDMTGLCLFVALAVLDKPEGVEAICDMINACDGRQLSPETFMELGKQILKLEREFNTRAGFSPADDRLPEFFYSEKISPHNIVFDIPDDELDSLFNF
jgi:aldehyde:ferredoxin oxidoreductase